MSKYRITSYVNYWDVRIWQAWTPDDKLICSVTTWYKACTWAAEHYGIREIRYG